MGTYSIEDAGEIDINELVGITPRWPDRAAFCDECKSEGGPDNWANRPQCDNFNWWHDIWYPEADAERVAAAEALFDKKFPHMPKCADLHPPPCDFNQGKYGFAGPNSTQSDLYPAMKAANAL